MKIDSIQNGNVVGLPLNDGRAQDKPGSASGAARDSLALSDLTTRIRQLGKQADGANGIDLERVNAIRQAIENGSYQISSAGIAGGLLDPVLRRTR